MRIIVDTNVFVSGIIWAGKPGEIVSKWLKSEYELILSEELLSEYLEIIVKLSSKPDLEKYWQSLLIRFAEFVKVNHTVNICRDPDDDFILALGLSSGADYIITGDQDILSLTDFPIKIRTPAAFLSESSTQH